MSELAKQLITKNKRTQAKSLDLGNCGLTELPPELLDCTWVENLNLGGYYYDEEKQDWERSKNQGKQNQIRELKGIERLQNLRILSFSSNQVSDISPVKDLANLQKLDFGGNQVSDISTLKDLVNLQNLSFSFNRVSAISPLKDLVNLKELSFSFNRVINISPVKDLVNLQKLAFSENQVIDISPVKDLVNLQNLYFWHNQVTDISPVKDLVNLQKLDFSENQVSDISPVKDLVNLKELSFSSNQVADISPVKDLVNLKELSFSSNQVADISPVKDLVNLQNLSFEGNQVSDISPVKDLVNLQNLFFWQNQVSDISPVKGLVNLKELNFSSNQVTDISPLKDLVNLKDLNFSSNQVADISPVKDLKNLYFLYAYGNPVKGIPPEYLGKSSNDNCIKKVRYYLEQEEKNSQYIFEAKLVLVGEPGAGKTSLSEKIRNPDYVLKRGSQSEPMTRGVAVSQWLFDYTNPKHTPMHAGFDRQFIAHIFDFGGQDILHATHRYFFSRRTVYLLVVDTRPEDTDFYYWLNIIELFGEQSPVIIVMNDKHDVYKDVPSHIVEKFAHLINNRIFHVNLRNNQGLTDLINMIQRELQQLPHVGKEKHSQSWVKIRQELNKKWLPDGILESLQVWKGKNEKKPFLTRQEYIDICENFGVVGEDKAMQIADTLHTLGSILYFQDNPALIDTLILDKHWATEAVYLVLLDKIVTQNYGKFTQADLERVWKGKYPIERHHALLALMLSFKIAYRVKDSQKYIATQLLAEKPPDTYQTLFAPETIFTHFEFRYPKFMPKGMLARLIVEMNKSIYQSLQWRYGVVLQIQDCLIEITEHRYGSTNKMAIRTTGREPLRAFSVVYHTFGEIHREFPNLVYEEMIPCNCEKCKHSNPPRFYEYTELQDFVKDGEPKIQCRESKKMVSVQELLEGRRQYEYSFSREGAHLLTLIDENQIPEFFQEIDRLGISNNEINSLRSEFISGAKDYDFAQRLKTFVQAHIKR
ncbi:MAG: leucine-rich repeat domain-containing protein [Thermoflexibacter sp.]|jgi:Leucine-rich repeat (LRR) protein/GTPase SAR1 family protein|nr:leucine-rich repeat domain-containing protein [Thermoflexibacter sp.]